MEISHILVPTDFSLFSDLAIKKAISLGKIFQAKITVLHVLTLSEVNVLTSQPGNPWENVVLQIQNDMMEEVRKVADPSFDLSKISLEVVAGEPVEEIARFADEGKVDLIIMGTHGRTGLASVFLGSVTIGVIKKTCAPVMVVKCAEALK
ncbi:MAG: universal stress protein [Candidatus Atribacteria bacterium]|nr:universal stress protein [Candidatus Atribacteria bacterium]